MIINKTPMLILVGTGRNRSSMFFNVKQFAIQMAEKGNTAKTVATASVFLPPKGLGLSIRKKKKKSR